MIALKPGQRLAPGQSFTHGLTLVYQNDGNIVLYRGGTPAWAAMVFAQPGYLEMQGDGNLVAYTSAFVPYWATDTYGPGAALDVDGNGMRVVSPVAIWEVEATPPNPGPGPSPGPGVVRLLSGDVRAANRSFADDSGPRLVHGCSDFTAMAKFNEDQATYLHNLDTTAQWQQYTRLGWRCNGWRFTPRGLDVDPYRHSWWEGALRGVLQAHQDRGLKVSLSSFDMNNWSDQQAEDAFRRVAHISAEYGDTVCFSAITNEMAGTWDPGETDEHVARGRELIQMVEGIYSRGLHAVSDPENRSEDGMRKLGWTMALIHQFGQPVDDGIRRAFNDMNENYPGLPIDQNEPRGPNGNTGDDVTSPIEDPNQLFALYTMHVLTGQASTYFNGPGAATRAPLDSTWGFKELPQLWRDLEIPENIGQGELCAGQHGTFMQVNGSHASRADGMKVGSYGLGVISGEWDGQPWKVRAGYDATWSVWYADGKAWEGRLSGGQVIPTPRGFTPAVVRAIA